MGIFSSHETFTNDVEIRLQDIINIESDQITFADGSCMRVLKYVNDKKDKFHELIKNGYDNKKNIFLQCHGNIIYGVSDNNGNGMWYFSNRISPTCRGHILNDS